MRALTDQERQNFPADIHVGVLSVAAENGRPPASGPIRYGYAPGGDIRINTEASSRNARLIKQTGAVTLVVQREEPEGCAMGAVLFTVRPDRWITASYSEDE